MNYLQLIIVISLCGKQHNNRYIDSVSMQIEE